MRGAEKTESLRRIVAEMAAEAERGNWRRVERLKAEGYAFARGSRSRQGLLREGYARAQDIIARVMPDEPSGTSSSSNAGGIE